MTASVREVTPHKAPTAAQRLLEQPIVPTLARLAAPNMLSMLASTAVGSRNPGMLAAWARYR